MAPLTSLPNSLSPQVGRGEAGAQFVSSGVQTVTVSADENDLRVDRFWTFDRWRLSAYLDVQNVYNRANQEGWQYSFDYRQRTPLTGLPILPILGAKGEW